MPRYGQLVMGPAGSGKSTFCSNIVRHCEILGRTVRVINLDPAAEHFDYPVYVDIRELIDVEDVMDDGELRLGPNGGLVFCMEYLSKNFDWLEEQLEDHDNDYFLFDCPGQIELYTHIPVMRQLVDTLQNWNVRVCGVFLIDSQFLLETSKFVSGVLTALSTMVSLEIPHVNVMTKLDLLSKRDKKSLAKFLDVDMRTLLDDEFSSRGSRKFKKLNEAIANMIDDYSLVQFLPLDTGDEESINDILLQIDNALQYAEDQEPKEPREPREEDAAEESDSGIGD